MFIRPEMLYMDVVFTLQAAIPFRFQANITEIIEK